MDPSPWFWATVFFIVLYWVARLHHFFVTYKQPTYLSGEPVYGSGYALGVHIAAVLYYMSAVVYVETQLWTDSGMTPKQASVILGHYVVPSFLLIGSGLALIVVPRTCELCLSVTNLVLVSAVAIVAIILPLCRTNVFEAARDMRTVSKALSVLGVLLSASRGLF